MPYVLICSEIGGGVVFLDSQLIECMGICFLSLAHGSEPRRSDVYLHFVKEKMVWKFWLNSARVHNLGWPLLGFFFGITPPPPEGFVGRIIYMEKCFRAQMFPVVWSVHNLGMQPTATL